MLLQLVAQQPPLKTNPDGVILVANTRVPLETVVTVFNRGATAEEIVQQYPALALADIYLVVGYYLQHRAEVDEYIQEQRAESVRVRAENETRFDPNGIRDRLLAHCSPLMIDNYRY